MNFGAVVKATKAAGDVHRGSLRVRGDEMHKWCDVRPDVHRGLCSLCVLFFVVANACGSQVERERDEAESPIDKGYAYEDVDGNE